MDAQASKDLRTNKGSRIPYLEKKISNFLDKSTVIVGGSGSGKSTLIEDLMHMLMEYIPVWLVICPTNQQNNLYTNKIPSACIKPDWSKEKIQKFWQRQECMAQIYSSGNNLNNLRYVFDAVASAQDTREVEVITNMARSREDDISRNLTMAFSDRKSAINDIKRLRDTKLCEIYKNCIRKNAHALQQRFAQPSANEQDRTARVVVEFLDMNPRVCLILDDCTENFISWMKSFKKSEQNLIKSLFFKGRHLFVTILFACHDDKAIDSELRKSTHNTIYTSSQAAVTSFERKSNGYSSIECKLACSEYIPAVFDNQQFQKNHRKLCYVREDVERFKYIVADVHESFTCGSTPLREFSRHLERKETRIADNPFVRHYA